MKFNSSHDLAPFQGHQKIKTYFEGWYIRLSSRETPWNFALIPGISISKDGKKAAFLQFIEAGGTSHYLPIHFDKFEASSSKFMIQFGQNIISDEQIQLDLNEFGVRLKVEITLETSSRFGSEYHPLNAMGWANLIPNLPCYHHIISMDSKTTGYVSWKDEQYDYNNGSVYMEKDWGSSFPKKWMWMQSSQLNTGKGVLSAATSKISVGPLKIPAGVAAFQFEDQRFFWSSAWGHRFSSKIKSKKSQITFWSPSYKLELTGHPGITAPLIAPKDGKMSRIIHESIDSEIEIRLTNHFGKRVFEGLGLNAGIETVH